MNQDQLVFHTVTTMPGINLTPKMIPGLPGAVLFAADELYLMASGPADVVRTGVTVKLPGHLYASLAPLPSYGVQQPFTVMPQYVAREYGVELRATIKHLGNADTVHIKPGDPVAMLLIHFAPTIHLAERAADVVQPAFRDVGQPANLGVA